MNDTPEIQPPQLAGVIGHPIGHSKSPRLHGYWLRNYKIRGYYIPMSVRPADLADLEGVGEAGAVEIIFAGPEDLSLVLESAEGGCV